MTFAQEDGRPIEFLHPVEAIGANGLHSIVVAPVLVRLDMLRKGRTYELLISRHAAGKADNGRRPPLETRVLFRGVHGRLELDLSGRDKTQAGAVLPTFYSLSGEAIAIPEQFRSAVRSIVKAANCSGCCHCHYVTAPFQHVTSPIVLPNRKHSFAADACPAEDVSVASGISAADKG